MGKTAALIAVIVTIILPWGSPDCRAAHRAPMRLAVQASCRYSIGHGWGHVFHCRICRILRGALPQEAIGLNVYGTVDLHGGVLRPFTNPRCLELFFERRGAKPKTMEGFRDDAGEWWELRFVKTCSEETMGPCRSRN
ncbi:MAG: hypothetical protein JXA20_02185 [Spirochaetes bacterium]|nr:hypothetical protein [Spirochaetota bacterium]